MPKELPEHDPIGAYQRKAIAVRRIGENAQCACGEKLLWPLVPDGKSVECHACKRRKRGQSPMDYHHVAGRANSSVTIPVPVNDHACLSAAQRNWPKQTLMNPDRSPILAVAACIRGLGDSVIYLVDTHVCRDKVVGLFDKLLLSTAETLEELDSYLNKKLGPKWWRDAELEQFTPEE